MNNKSIAESKALQFICKLWGFIIGAIPGDPNWNPIYDLTCDNYVGIDDIVEIADHFGQTDP